MKPGIFTTEFWLAVATVVANLLLVLTHILPPQWGATLAFAQTVIYAAMRSWAKNNHQLSLCNVLAELNATPLESQSALTPLLEGIAQHLGIKITVQPAPTAAHTTAIAPEASELLKRFNAPAPAPGTEPPR